MTPEMVWIIGGIAIVYIIRLAIVDNHRKWVVWYLKELCYEYAEKCKAIALKDCKGIPKEEEDRFIEDYKKKLKVMDNLWNVFYCYPTRWDLAFDLTKWTRDDMFPYLELNMALALDDRIEDIDYDLIK